MNSYDYILPNIRAKCPRMKKQLTKKIRYLKYK